MESQIEQTAGIAHCPACGSPLDSRATICSACGVALALPASQPPVASEPEANPPPSQLPVMGDIEAQPAQHVQPEVAALDNRAQKRCDWCGAMNPEDVQRCEACQAMFPRPEQDEAMRRAGEARIQVVEDEIALRQRVRKRRGLSRLFG